MYLKAAMAAATLAVLATLPAHAQQQQAPQLDCGKSFGFRADIDGVRGNTLCSSRVDAFIDSAENFSLSNKVYTSSSAATAQARFNDVNMVLEYAANSNTLQYRFVELGISGSFTGASRDAAEDEFGEFVKKSDILGKVLRYQAQHSPTSAITGTGGAIPMLAVADFATGFDAVGRAGQENGKVNNLLGIGMGYSSYNIDGQEDGVKTLSLPLSYTVRSSSDARRQLILSMPITQVTTGDAKAYHAGLGVAVRLPLTDRWSVTPGARYSVVASVDRATVATVMSGSLMSTYVLPLGKVDLAVGNMIGLYRTGKFSSGDYSFDPDVKLKLTRNGLMGSFPTGLLGGLAAEVSLIDTRYLGEKPFVSDSQEIGITLGTNARASNARSFTRVGLSFTRSNVDKGVNLNMGYWF